MLIEESSYIIFSWNILLVFSLCDNGGGAIVDDKLKSLACEPGRESNRIGVTQSGNILATPILTPVSQLTSRKAVDIARRICHV